jgi:hypothetical protein
MVREFTEKTGIHSVTKRLYDLLGIDCGCEERQEKLNKIKIKKWKRSS